MSKDGERFVGEALIPEAGSFETAGPSRREPGLPARFTWRGRQYRIVALMGKWKADGPCRSGAAEMYLRRHWYKIRTDPEAVMTIYFDRQAIGPQETQGAVVDLHRRRGGRRVRQTGEGIGVVCGLGAPKA